MMFKRGDHVRVVGGGWCEGITGHVTIVYPDGDVEMQPDVPSPKPAGFWTNADKLFEPQYLEHC